MAGGEGTLPWQYHANKTYSILHTTLYIMYIIIGCTNTSTATLAGITCSGTQSAGSQGLPPLYETLQCVLHVCVPNKGRPGNDDSQVLNVIHMCWESLHGNEVRGMRPRGWGNEAKLGGVYR